MPFVFQELDFEDLRQPHIYQLLVTATEDSGGFSTSVELTIRNAHNFLPFNFFLFFYSKRNASQPEICF
jgi:hypothetical protein